MRRRPRDRARHQHRDPAHAARRGRVRLHLPGRDRSPPARARGAHPAAPGRRRRDGRRDRARDSQPAGVDVRLAADPAAGAAAQRRAVAADGHRAPRVRPAERDDSQLSRLRPAAAERVRQARRAADRHRHRDAAAEQPRAARDARGSLRRAARTGVVPRRRGADPADRLEPGDQRAPRDGRGRDADARGGTRRGPSRASPT